MGRTEWGCVCSRSSHWLNESQFNPTHVIIMLLSLITIQPKAQDNRKTKLQRSYMTSDWIDIFDITAQRESSPSCVSDLWPLQRCHTSAPDVFLRRSCFTCSVTPVSTRKCTLTRPTVWARLTTCTHATTRWTTSSCCCRWGHTHCIHTVKCTLLTL